MKAIFLLFDNIFSLKSKHSTFNEVDLAFYKEDLSSRLLTNFLEVALAGISTAF